jgi:hypothetical protein
MPLSIPVRSGWSVRSVESGKREERVQRVERVQHVEREGRSIGVRRHALHALALATPFALHTVLRRELT